jgi:probable ribonuclease FAU-1
MPLYQKGQPITVHHGKPWKPCKPIQMKGHVASFDGETVRMARQFRSPGTAYDGLYATQRRGDHGTIELPRGAWVVRRRYLRQSGALIGELYNIQTPVELHPREVRYVDLEIDVAYLPHRPERVMIQDVAELETAVERGYIPGEVAEVAREVAEELARRLGQWDGESALEWDVRPTRLPAAVEDFLQRHTVRPRAPLT